MHRTSVSLGFSTLFFFPTTPEPHHQSLDQFSKAFFFLPKKQVLHFVFMSATSPQQPRNRYGAGRGIHIKVVIFLFRIVLQMLVFHPFHVNWGQPYKIEFTFSVCPLIFFCASSISLSRFLDSILFSDNSRTTSPVIGSILESFFLFAKKTSVAFCFYVSYITAAAKEQVWCWKGDPY